jgi:hypothetical protein
MFKVDRLLRRRCEKIAEGANIGRQSRINCQRVEDNAFHRYWIQAISAVSQSLTPSLPQNGR